MMSRLSRRVGILLVVVVTLLVGRSVFAQSGPLGATNNPLTLVIAKLDQILAKLSPAAPQPGPVTLTTGFLFSGGPTDAFVCTFLNVGSNPLVVSIKMRNASNSVIRDPGPQTARPGFPVWEGALTPAPGTSPYFCEFAFEGFANDVRASAQVAVGNTTTAVLAVP